MKMYMFKFFLPTAHAVADRGVWDESADKMAAKWRSRLSPYTISSSELSEEEDTVPHRSSPSIDCESKEEDSEQESSDTESGPEARKQEDSKGARKKKTDNKKGRKSSWQERHINDLVDIICSSEYYKKRLIFINMKNSKNGEIYQRVLKELKERYDQQGDVFPFNVAQIRNKFKKCMSDCKKIALTVKTATGIKRIQEEKHFGSWFSQLFELVKTRDSCRPEMTIEPSACTELGGEEKRVKREHGCEPRPEHQARNEAEDADDKDKAFFVPIKKAPRKAKKKEDSLSSVVQMVQKVVDQDTTKELLHFSGKRMKERVNMN